MTRERNRNPEVSVAEIVGTPKHVWVEEGDTHKT